jgi:hypothetical protein
LKKNNSENLYIDEVISSLADKFNVSNQAMTIRLQTLGLISY